jgi:hypothetical protein
MMAQKRFGRKIPLSSKMEIKRDLVLMGRADTLTENFNKDGGSEEDLARIINELIDEHRISLSRAQMLINRCVRDRVRLADASQNKVGL